ncbi:hypothetical protein HYZ99_03060 [Candidatus Peregrinibacteria bacterium]|nr:hypothetical protein [Candidatus Peregrinibacteria bacterium]
MTPAHLLLSLLIIAAPAHARDAFEWNFMDASIPGRWEIQRLTTATPTAAGLHIKTDVEGKMSRVTEFPHGVEAIVMSLGQSTPTEAILLWHIRGSPANEFVELPFEIAGGPRTEVKLAVNDYPQWDPRTDRIGIVFPPHAEVTIQRIAFFRWNLFEKTWEAVKSFWTLDTFRPYTINFLWGPVLTFNPISRERLFRSIPPVGWSVNRILYVTMILIGLACMFWHMRQKRRGVREALRRPLTIFLLSLAGLWLFYDLRMGLETIAYYVRDYRTYVAADADERTFRDRGYFYDFVDQVLPHVQGRKRYIFLSPFRWPYLGAVRYLTYPSIPTEPTQAENGVDTWVIFQRSDMSVNAEGSLLMDGQVVTPPGTVLLDFAPGSFVFRTRPAGSL